MTSLSHSNRNKSNTNVSKPIRIALAYVIKYLLTIVPVITTIAMNITAKEYLTTHLTDEIPLTIMILVSDLMLSIVFLALAKAGSMLKVNRK